MFWYKRGRNWLGAIKGMALWSRGFSRGSLFKTWPKLETAHEKPLAPRVEVVTRILFFCGYCLSAGRQDLPTNAESIFFDLFWNVRLYLRLNKGFRMFNFLQSASWIWITKSDFLLSAMVSSNVLLRWSQLVSFCFFFRNVKFSRIVIYRSKFQKMDCTLNWSYINNGELHCDFWIS